MVHKSSIIPGLSHFIDTAVLSHYPPTSMKRIFASGAIALFLKQNSDMVDQVLNNPLISGLNISDEFGMVNIDMIRDIYKAEIQKAGFLRIHIPILGDVDFTADDLDALYKSIVSANGSPTSVIPSQPVNINSVQGV